MVKTKVVKLKINTSSGTLREEKRIICKAPNRIGSAGAIRSVVGLVLDWFCNMSVIWFGLAQGLGSFEPRGPSKS